MPSRRAAFASIVAGCTAAAVGYVTWAAVDTESPAAGVEVVATAPRGDSAPSAVPPGTRPVKVPRARALMVRAVDPEDPRLNGAVTVIPTRGGAPRRSGGLACQRLHFAGGKGLCLAVARSGVDYQAHVFDRRFKTRRTFTITGLPSRARISPDGRYGAFTTFVTGHSYATPGSFSTSTNIVRMTDGEVIANLEDFEVSRAGRVIRSPDFNFWGVTFARDSNRFYATLATGGEHHLVEGDVRKRRARVLTVGVECPALSPDGTRVAYKRGAGEGRWRLHVLDLRTMRDVALAEKRSIDDQAEWLDGDTVVYGDGRDVWSVPADGRGRPLRLLAGATSPTPMR